MGPLGLMKLIWIRKIRRLCKCLNGENVCVCVCCWVRESEWVRERETTTSCSQSPGENFCRSRPNVEAKCSHCLFAFCFFMRREVSSKRSEFFYPNLNESFLVNLSKKFDWCEVENHVSSHPAKPQIRLRHVVELQLNDLSRTLA